ncbi:MAG: 5-dehydro-4-deoxy-D-glucuronate isomerase [Acidobacteriaceae bacterium]
MKTMLMADPVRYPHMTTEQLRETFLLNNLFQPDKLSLAYLDLDRAIAGFAAPLTDPLMLPCPPELRAGYFMERRELGVLNTGGAGRVHVDREVYALENLDVLYIGRGHANVRFESPDPERPAVFYLLSYPAHVAYPTTLVKKEDAQPTTIGSQETCNLRTICKYIHIQGARSCQLVLGVTHLHAGSAWNTMPPHTHMRRSEIYMYFNLPAEARVFHLMGLPQETRHLVLANRDIVVSPGWSIHAGFGTQAYSFCWGMGGENQDYADMDPVRVEELL